MVGTVALGGEVAGREGFKHRQGTVGMVMDQAVCRCEPPVIAWHIVTARNHRPQHQRCHNHRHQLSHGNYFYRAIRVIRASSQ